MKGRWGTNMYVYLTHRDQLVASRNAKAHIYHLQAFLTFELQLRECQAKGREDMEGSRRDDHDDEHNLSKRGTFPSLAHHDRCSYRLSKIEA